jgi:dipeptidyl aminopeptidase/acylaminoacyl peptidase
MKRMIRIGGAWAVLAAGAALQSRPISPEDVYRLLAVADAQLSPDGRLVAYVVTGIDREKNRRVSGIWTVPADGTGEPKPFIQDVPARAPRWSPDGKWLAFVSNSGGKNQVWIVARDGSGRRRITSFAGGASACAWSPDGAMLAVTAKPAAHQHDVRDYTTMLYKQDGAGFIDDARSHIYIVAVADGSARPLTTGDDRNDSEPVWSHDGRSIAYISEQVGPELRNTFDNGGIMIISSDGGAPRAVARRRAYIGRPSFSPDDTRIAFAAAPTPADQQLLFVAAVDGTAEPALAADLDLFPDEVEWSGNAIWFGAKERGAASIYRIQLPGRHAVKVLGGDRALHGLSISEAAHRLVYLENDDTHPVEVFASDENGGHERRLTFHNRDLLHELDLAPSERVSWKSPDGLPIEGFLKKPVDWQPGRKYPMILAIHGGPNGMFGFHWEFDEQLYAGNGYAVLLTNPRGSSGYGSKFQRAVALEWGGKAYQDIMSGVDAALARNPWIDPNRLGVVGHSYGGFMTDWIVTQTHRFKAAISISGIADFISVEGTRDAAYGHSRDFGGDLYTAFDRFWKYSPLRLAANVKTPILFLHGDADQRVPVSQAEEYFRAIKHFGGTAELVIFPRESHSLPLSAEPRHLVETYQWRIYWFNRWLKGDRAPAPDAEIAEPRP